MSPALLQFLIILYLTYYLALQTRLHCVYSAQIFE